MDLKLDLSCIPTFLVVWSFFLELLARAQDLRHIGGSGSLQHQLAIELLLDISLISDLIVFV
jgi:hypothetical protein